MTTLFATYLHEADFTGTRNWAELNEDLEQACLMLAEDDTAGQDWCEREGYPGYTSYSSLDDLPARATAFSDLKKMLDREARTFAETLQWDMAGRRLKLDSLWVNVLEPGGFHTGHIHPLSVISGTYYVAIPEGAAAIQFEDPRLPMMMAAPSPRADADEGAKRFVKRAPRPGMALFWESWLRHEVLLNAADDARISISFNYALA